MRHDSTNQINSLHSASNSLHPTVSSKSQLLNPINCLIWSELPDLAVGTPGFEKTSEEMFWTPSSNMSDLPTSVVNERKKRGMPWRSRVALWIRTMRMKLRSRDRLTVVVAFLTLLTVVVVSWSWLANGNKASQFVDRSDKDDLAVKDLLGLEKSFHELLNKKVLSSKTNYEGIGFGNAGIKRLHHKPGTPPTPQFPGIWGDMESHSNGGEEFSKRSLFNLWGSRPRRKIYMILGRNQEAGIKNRKRREHWLMEKFSIINKKIYADKHGYELIITSSTPLSKEGKVKNLNIYQKRYQHESREGWEKFDLIRRVMRENTVNNNPEDPTEVEEWYWYIDMNTLIMEPEISLESLILDHLDTLYRDMEYFDPNNLYDEQHIKEKKDFYDEDANSVDLILTQDCKGINLNSFLIRRSHWTNLLLDLLWEPVFYKQMHLKWLSDSSGSSKYGFTLNSQEHTDYGYNNDREEKNCLEFLINTQAWIRSKIGFLPIRVINSLSKDFCEDEDDEISSMEDLIGMDQHQKSSVDSNTNSYLSNKHNFHYNETDRDFLVNFMMCERFGNCWDRFRQFSQLNEKLHRSWFSSWF